MGHYEAVQKTITSLYIIIGAIFVFYAALDGFDVNFGDFLFFGAVMLFASFFIKLISLSGNAGFVFLAWLFCIYVGYFVADFNYYRIAKEDIKVEKSSTFNHGVFHTMSSKNKNNEWYASLTPMRTDVVIDSVTFECQFYYMNGEKEKGIRTFPRTVTIDSRVKNYEVRVFDYYADGDYRYDKTKAECKIGDVSYYYFPNNKDVILEQTILKSDDKADRLGFKITNNTNKSIWRVNISCRYDSYNPINGNHIDARIETVFLEKRYENNNYRILIKPNQTLEFSTEKVATKDKQWSKCKIYYIDMK